MNKRNGRLGKELESETAVEPCGLFVLRLDDDREDGERARGGKDSPDSVGQQQVADPLSAHPPVTREASDQRCRNEVVAAQALGVLAREIGDRQRERAETIETDHTQAVVNRDEDARDVPFLVLPGSMPEPIVERSDAA